MAVPVMAIMMLMTAQRKIMGDVTVPVAMRVIGWIATLVMAIAACVMLAQNLL